MGVVRLQAKCAKHRFGFLAIQNLVHAWPIELQCGQEAVRRGLSNNRHIAMLQSKLPTLRPNLPLPKMQHRCCAKQGMSGKGQLSVERSDVGTPCQGI